MKLSDSYLYNEALHVIVSAPLYDTRGCVVMYNAVNDNTL